MANWAYETKLANNVICAVATHPDGYTASATGLNVEDAINNLKTEIKKTKEKISSMVSGEIDDSIL